MPGFARVIRRKLRVLQTRAAEARSVRREHGTAAAVQFAATVAGSIVRERFFRAPPQSNSFDEEFGTDTAAKTKLHTLDIESPNYGFAIYYEPTDSACSTSSWPRCRFATRTTRSSTMAAAKVSSSYAPPRIPFATWSASNLRASFTPSRERI